MKRKYLLCIPQGGFSDNLKVMSKCLAYAIKHDRYLVINTKNGSLGFNLTNYFELIDEASEKIRIHYDDFTESLLNDLSSSVPNCIKGAVTSFTPVGGWIGDAYKYTDVDSGQVLNFDFSRDYEEDLLIHYWYGQDISYEILNYLTLSDDLRTFISEKLNAISYEYDAIHIRYTDKKVDYFSFLEELGKIELSQNILLCTDNRAVFDDLTHKFPTKNIFCLSMPPLVDGMALHDKNTLWKFSLDSDMMNKNMLLDLFGLANSRNLYYPTGTTMLGPGGEPISGGSISGFSDLANYLHKNQDLYSQMFRTG